MITKGVPAVVTLLVQHNGCLCVTMTVTLILQRNSHVTVNNEFKSMRNESRDLPRHLHGRMEKSYEKAQHNNISKLQARNIATCTNLHVKLHLGICIAVLANAGHGGKAPEIFNFTTKESLVRKAR